MANPTPFQQGYLDCALWRRPDDAPAGAELHPDALARLLADAAEFEREHRALLDAANDAGYPDDSCGHDLWLTRNGHGAGFWDRGLGDVGERLTAAAEACGACDLYVGDDGFLYAT